MSEDANRLLAFTVNGQLHVARYLIDDAIVEVVVLDGSHEEVKHRIPAANREEAKNVALSFIEENWPDSSVR